eukprot:1836800-Alexandrium_andersonii.AAC.1
MWPGEGPTGNLSSTCVPWDPLHIETVLAPALQDVAEDSPQVAVLSHTPTASIRGAMRNHSL